MMITHCDETFTDMCIEGEYKGHEFKNCTFIACYLEIEDAKFIDCKFDQCHIVASAELFPGGQFTSTITKWQE